MDNKKKFAAICIGVLILAAGVGTTLAYLGAKQNADNTIKVGTDIAQVSETFTEPSIQEQSNETTKEIKVKNTGSVPCFVRVYAEFSDSEIASIAKVVYGDSNTDEAWNTFKSNKNIIAYTNLTDDWVYIPEGDSSGLGGYFYYTKVVPVDDAATTDVDEGVTSSLIKKVKVDYGTMPGNSNSNIDYIRDYEMIVYTETVQTVDTDGTDYAAQGVTDGWKNAWYKFLNKTSLPTT